MTRVTDSPPFAGSPRDEAAPVRVAFVEDHEAVRLSIGTMLGRRGCVVTASAGSAADGYDAIVSCPPDVALIDVHLPDEPGPSLARRLLDRHPDLGVIFYSAIDDALRIRHALDAGGRGFVSKAAGLAELRHAIGAVAAGRTYIDARVAPVIAASRGGESVHRLTRREREVLELLARGHTGEDAARLLFISPETIRVHVRNAMRKLDAGTRVHVVVSALVHGEIAL